MKYPLALLISCFAINGIAQEPREVTFDDGTVVNITLNYDYPDRMYDLSVSANYGEITLSNVAIGVFLKPAYKYSDKLNFDCNIFLPIAGTATRRLDQQLLRSTKKTLEFFPEAHYKLKSTTEAKNKFVQAEYTRGFDFNTNYLVEMPLKIKKEIFFDGGINYSQFTSSNTFQSDDEEEYTLYGQGIVALTAGISRVKTNNYKLTLDDRVYVYARSSQLSFKVLLGVPTAADIVRSYGPNDDLNYEFDPTTGYEMPDFLNIGARLGIDRIRSFAKRPKIFITWGFHVGVNPAYGGGDGELALLNKGMIYSGARLGFGFGRIPK
ncbi:MAG: hypothetical protein ACI8ZM_000843 [Crocinitomix sp.]|jgi:hypothetical protein